MTKINFQSQPGLEQAVPGACGSGGFIHSRTLDPAIGKCLQPAGGNGLQVVPAVVREGGCFVWGRDHMPIEWKASLSVGDFALDRDHQQLIGIMNNFMDAVVKNHALEERGRVLNDLLLYTKNHFQKEEAYLQQIDYPGLAAHQEAHAALMRQVFEFRMKFLLNPDQPSQDLFAFLNHWLINHIIKMDLQYREFVSATATPIR
ncbi:MAG: hemerythrin family protein [Magnetococcales bacterium]|nr:hemerythrin family protein [Magnetococcales bacterium]